MLRTAKYRAIVEDPVIRYKPVESLPGIGPVHGRRLRDNGFNTADQVLAQYLALKRNEQRFISWMTMVSGVSAHWAAQCFNVLNDWYNIWGRDVQIPKRSITPPKEKGSLTNRMLLEQKMMQFNSKANDDRLRSLFSNQTISLVDISRTAERPTTLALERLNKSNYNLAENSLCYSEQVGKKHFKKLPSPGPKSVNFKENVEFNATMPKKSPIGVTSKRPISPILKSRSLTPDIQQYIRKPNNIQNSMMNSRNEIKSKGSSMNNLNMPGKITKKEKTKAKSIENVSGSNTFTKSKSRPQAASRSTNLEKVEKLICTCDNLTTPVPIQLNFNETEELVCTCDFPYRKEDPCNSSTASEGTKVSHNIEEYFVEKQIDAKQQHFVPNVSSTPSKLKDSNNNKSQEWNQKELKAQNGRTSNNINIDEYMEAIEDENTFNGDNDSVISSDYVFTEHEDLQENNESGVTVDSRDLENVELRNQRDNCVTVEFTENVKHFHSVESKDVQCRETMTTSSNCTNYEASFIDHSNEDSGLDVTPKRTINYQAFAGETPTTDDERSTTIDNVDSQSETDTDRTFEVNDTTDAESGFHYLSTNSNSRLECVKEDEINAVREIVESQIDQCNHLNMDDDLKRSNIRLFCDMLSSDLEQLPMEKFRRLKLNILKLVYAEIDGTAEQ